jgi:hypothetical protein
LLGGETGGNLWTDISQYGRVGGSVCCATSDNWQSALCIRLQRECSILLRVGAVVCLSPAFLFFSSSVKACSIGKMFLLFPLIQNGYVWTNRHIFNENKDNQLWKLRCDEARR